MHLLIRLVCVLNLELTQQQKADLAAINAKAAQEKAEREAAAPLAPKKPKTARNVMLGLIGLAIVGVFVFLGPQMRAAAERQENSRNAELVRKSQEAETQRRREERARRQAGQVEIAAATLEQLRTLVTACRDAIREKLTDPFEVYFGRYSATELQPLITVIEGFGSKTGRPSVFLDNYDFDPIAYNVGRLQDPDWREIWDISLVVEGAVESFSIKRYVAIWECDVIGLTPVEPKETKRVYYE